MRRLLLAVTTLAVLLLVALDPVGRRRPGVRPPESGNTMPLTTVMGNWLAWLTPGLIGVGRCVRLPGLAKRSGSCRPARRSFGRGTGRGSEGARDDYFGGTGWKANFGEARPERRAAAIGRPGVLASPRVRPDLAVWP